MPEARNCSIRGAASAVALCIALFAATPATAQYVCINSATDFICNNSGVAGAQNTFAGAGINVTTNNSGTSGAILTDAATGNATTSNTGTVAGNLLTSVTATGNASSFDSGIVTGFMFAASVNGSATATNTGSVAGTITAIVNTSGNATGSNSGSAAGLIVESVVTGGASAINTGTLGATGLTAAATTGDVTAISSGSVGLGGITANTTTGNALTFNSGADAAFMLTQTFTGNATTTNTGSVAAYLITETVTGNATTINTGIIAGFVETLASVNATTINSGSIGGDITTMTLAGNAVTINNGSVAGNILTTVIASGNAGVINTGFVGGFVSVGTTSGNASVVNSGTISGPVFVGANGTETLTNSGTIGTAGGIAIAFNGGPDTLNLLAGSTLIGDIDLVGTNDTVNFLGGNHNLTFNTLAGATVTGAIPFVVAGNRAAAIDPTPFGLADKGVMDFSRGISGILTSLGGASAAANGPLSSAFAPSDSIAARVDDAFAAIPALAYAGDAMVFKNPTMVASDGRSAWARGFAGEHVQDADGPLLRATTVFTGGAVGFDMVARPDLRLGVFAGGGQSRMSLDQNVGRTDTDTAFGGLYGRWSFASFDAPSFVDVALHGGSSSNTTLRNINNNTLANGLETATASYASRYVSPEIAYGVNLPLWSEYTLTPSLRVRYVAGFFDGYTESGSTANLTVASRTIQDFEERGELKLTRSTTVGPDLLLTSVYLGALGIERAGDTTVNTVLLGASLPFVTPGKNTVGGVLGGGGLEWRTREDISFFGAAEAIGMSDQGTVVSARGGMRVAF